jgi:hypothetical protein
VRNRHVESLPTSKSKQVSRIVQLISKKGQGKYCDCGRQHQRSLPSRPFAKDNARLVMRPLQHFALPLLTLLCLTSTHGQELNKRQYELATDIDQVSIVNTRQGRSDRFLKRFRFFQDDNKEEEGLMDSITGRLGSKKSETYDLTTSGKKSLFSQSEDNGHPTESPVHTSGPTPSIISVCCCVYILLFKKNFFIPWPPQKNINIPFPNVVVCL